MSLDVQQFLSALTNGGARQNLFEVHLRFPTTIGNTNEDKFKLMCKSASLPPSEIGTITVPYKGRSIKLAGDRVFPDWNVTVINDEDWDLRTNFEEWMNLLNAHAGNVRAGSAVTSLGYQTDATVYQLSRTGDVIRSYTIIGLWPSLVSQIDLGWSDNDAIEEFAVTFQYQWWESLSTDHSPTSVNV